MFKEIILLRLTVESYVVCLVIYLCSGCWVKFLGFLKYPRGISSLELFFIFMKLSICCSLNLKLKSFLFFFPNVSFIFNP